MLYSFEEYVSEVSSLSQAKLPTKTHVFDKVRQKSAKKHTKVTRLNIMQLFYNENSAIHSQLYENVSTVSSLSHANVRTKTHVLDKLGQKRAKNTYSVSH